MGKMSNALKLRLYYNLLFQGVFIFYIISYEPVRYDDEKFPKWAQYLGLMISFSSMIWVPAYAIYYLVTQPGSFMEVSYSPCRDFGDPIQDFIISKRDLNTDLL